MCSFENPPIFGLGSKLTFQGSKQALEEVDMKENLSWLILLHFKCPWWPPAFPTAPGYYLVAASASKDKSHRQLGFAWVASFEGVHASNWCLAVWCTRTERNRLFRSSCCSSSLLSSSLTTSLRLEITLCTFRPAGTAHRSAGWIDIREGRIVDLQYRTRHTIEKQDYTQYICMTTRYNLKSQISNFLSFLHLISRLGPFLKIFFYQD